MSTKRSFYNLLPERNGKQPQSLPLVYTDQADKDDEGGLDLGQLLAALRRRTLLVASVTTAVASAAVAIALTSNPIYEAKFALLTQPVTVENKLLSSVPESLNDNNQDSNQVEDKTQQIAILLSPKLIAPIVKQIETQYPPIVKQTEAKYTGSTLPELNNLPALTIDPIKSTNILEVTYQDSNPEKVQFVLDLVAKAYLKYSLDERQKDVRQGIQFVEAQLPGLQQRVAALQGRLQKFRQQYDIIDPVGQGQQLSAQLSTVVQQRLDTQTQLSKTRALYRALQKQLQLQSNEAAAASALTEAPRYQSLLNQLQEVQTKIAVETVRYQEDSPTIQSLRTQEQNLLTLVARERLDILGKNSPTVLSKSPALASQNSIRSQQTQQFFDTARQIQVLEAQNQTLTQIESTLRKQVKQFPILARQNEDLERQLKIAVDNLNQFLTKREALRIDAAQKQIPWQLLTPPTKPQPSSQSVKRNLILGTALGLLMGIGAALLVDKFKNLLYTPQDVKDTTGLPLVGEIPFKPASEQIPANGGLAGLLQLLNQNLKRDKRKYQTQQQNSAQFWESLRSLYTNIRFLSFDTPVRSLAVISATAEDGRSTIAIHLAQTAAVMGQRVLLVEADLRNPKIHKIFGLDDSKGLSNVIAANLDVQEVIHKIHCVSMEAVDNTLPKSLTNPEPVLEDVFFVLPAGSIPPNPTNLLSSQKMQNLARRFEDTFDLIIYDTPPVTGLADSSLIAACTGASILVVGLEKTHRLSLAKALEGLKIANTPVLGVVANGVTNYTN